MEVTVGVEVWVGVGWKHLVPPGLGLPCPPELRPTSRLVLPAARGASGRLAAGTVIVCTEPSGVSISICMSSVTVWSTACSSSPPCRSSPWLSTSTCTVSPFSSCPRIAIT